MISNNPYNQYKTNFIFTASPEDLTLMLYNGLIKFIMIAQKAIDEKDISKAHESIIRAEAIVNEFLVTLDMRYEVSQSMALLYDYMNRRLIAANMKKDREILEEVLGLSKGYRDTWAQAMKIAKQQQPKLAVGE